MLSTVNSSDRISEISLAIFMSKDRKFSKIVFM